ncbi:MAG TPA: hypothetical protein VMR70_03715 [Flavisolibacter sp.]|nr:hypothetical protein [Flavisolibacter sp.]
MNKSGNLQTAIHFLRTIGIEVIETTLLAAHCFLPGLLIKEGKIFIDKEQLLYPGDILHEAGHLAVIPQTERHLQDGTTIGKRPDAPAEEMMAIAWSYAACLHLQIDPVFVFHNEGYKQGGSSLVDNFRQGRYIGVPVLEWLGMTTTKGEGPLYPAMLKWLRD